MTVGHSPFLSLRGLEERFVPPKHFLLLHGARQWVLSWATTVFGPGRNDRPIRHGQSPTHWGE